MINGEQSGTDGGDWSRQRLDARAADALIAEAAPDLEATARHLEAFAAAAPILDHPDAKRELTLFRAVYFVALKMSPSCWLFTHFSIAADLKQDYFTRPMRPL
jgi:hypothetical protein